jgi:hypothetical protein
VRLAADSEGRVIADAIRLERVFATSGGTLARSGALLPEAVELPAAFSGESVRPREIDDAVFSPLALAHRQDEIAARRFAFAAEDETPTSAPADAGESPADLALLALELEAHLS